MTKKALLVTRVSGFIPQFEMNNVRILQQMGYEVHYAANYQQVVYGKDNSRLMNTGIIRHHIPFGRSPFALDTWRCYKSLKNLMQEENFDLIHCHMPITGVLTRMAAHSLDKSKKRHIPVVYTAHGFHFFKGAPLSNWIYYFPERFFSRYTDALLLINKEDYKRARRFPVRGCVEYIPGVGTKPMPEPDSSFDLRTHFHIPSDHKIAVSVGELSEVKNHMTAIKAIDRFRKDTITYIICGQGPLENELKKAVHDMHLEKKVILAGYCENIPDILRQSDLFIFPSIREGLPVSMMEAMQAGLPVLAANIRGNHDLMEDGKGGFLFEENLTEDYVRGIRYFLSYPQEAVRMGEWNREKIKNFDIEIVSGKMREIYKGLSQ